jgi:hypothetical protein
VSRRIKCLACGRVSTSVREHRRHLAGADHPDEGESYLHTRESVGPGQYTRSEHEDDRGDRLITDGGTDTAGPDPTRQYAGDMSLGDHDYSQYEDTGCVGTLPWVAVCAVCDWPTRWDHRESAQRAGEGHKQWHGHEFTVRNDGGLARPGEVEEDEDGKERVTPSGDPA